jgi:hypothetical protein
MICIPVTLRNGRSDVLLLDTGNINSWLMADSAATLGLNLEPLVHDGKSIPGVFRLGVQSVSLRGRTLTGQFLALTREEAGELPPEVEGALAYTLFKDKVLQIDYPRRMVRLLDSESQGSAAAGRELKLVTFGEKGPPIVVGRGFSERGDRGECRLWDLTLLAGKSATVYFSGAGKNPVHQPDGLFGATGWQRALQPQRVDTGFSRDESQSPAGIVHAGLGPGALNDLRVRRG